ncbi:hypothetical protein TWF718_000019 [Orbilia javanica]|uniref:Uncharacterized protein n=1 Tax=Orbilia javanica TaxID=47235 RepID=A0AAN8NDP0_9PEZI
MPSTDMEYPTYVETEGEEPLSAPPYQPTNLSDHELEIYEEIQNYYYRGPYDSPICISFEPANHPIKWKKYLLPLVYTIAITATTVLHRQNLRENNVPYFLMAVYNTIAVMLAVVGIVYNSFRPKHPQDIESHPISWAQTSRTDHWKPFAFILLYMASEEGFWFSLASMPLVRQRVAYLAYPLFVAFFTWEWVLGGNKTRAAWIEKKDLDRLKIAALVGGLGVSWGYQTSFEWWGCIVAVAALGFKNIITRDILITSQHNAPEMVMLAASTVSFRALLSCYGSPEYSMVWPHLTGLSWECCLKVLAVGSCYGIAQLALVEMGRVWEPVKGSWAVMGPALVGGIWGLVQEA